MNYSITLILLLFTSSISFSYSQSNMINDSSKLNSQENVFTYFIRMKLNNPDTLGFILPDSLMVEIVDENKIPRWRSHIMQGLFWDFNKKDGNSYIMKVDVPDSISNFIKEFWCFEAKISSHYDTIIKKYKLDTSYRRIGGARPGNIRLNIISNPQGAEVYLISKRFWDENSLDISSFERNLSNFQSWKVNTKLTDTYAMIDETVFVVLVKLKGVVKKIIYKTLPLSIQKVQTATIELGQ